MPRNPFGEMAAAAVQLHELFSSFVAAGFTRAEALEIMIRMATSSAPRN